MEGMKRMKIGKERIVFLTVFALLLMVFALAGCSSNSYVSETFSTGIDPEEWNSLAFKDEFPKHWESYLKNLVNEKEVKPKSDPSIEPYLPILWNGFGFAVEYNLTRGHTFAFEDQANVRRITDNPNAITACMSCKSIMFPKMLDEFGDKAWSMNYHTELLPWLEEVAGDDKGTIKDSKGNVAEWGHISIGCATCHEPETMELRITLPQLTVSLENMGYDITKATKQDMRSLVCAQCHVEYFFDPTNNAHTTFPWDNGLKVEDMWTYYDEIWGYNEATGELGYRPGQDGKFKGEYVSRLTNTPMQKAQHPEYELSSYGPHQTVSCADCHMPYQRNEGEKMTSHRWGSPLKTIDESCRTCHADKSATYLEDRVKTIQTRHKSALLEAQDLSVDATYYVNRLMVRLEEGKAVDPAVVNKTRYLQRKGQWFWDIIAAENSYGFHNPDGSMDAYRMSMKESAEVIRLATIELMKIGEDIDELNRQIEVTKQNVINQEVSHEKHKDAINEWFPNLRDK